jgi:hypothetical protein
MSSMCVLNRAIWRSSSLRSCLVDSTHSGSWTHRMLGASGSSHLSWHILRFLLSWLFSRTMWAMLMHAALKQRCEHSTLPRLSFSSMSSSSRPVPRRRSTIQSIPSPWYLPHPEQRSDNGTMRSEWGLTFNAVLRMDLAVLPSGLVWPGHLPNAA